MKPDPVGSRTFFWIRNYLFRILYYGNNEKQINNQNFTSFLLYSSPQKVQWNFISKVMLISALWIRIRMDPELLPGSGSGIIVPDPDPAKSERTCK